MPTSIRDIAERAGVSRGTVSKVLNGSTTETFTAETKLRVRRIAGELGYHPNRMARSLGRGRTDTVGLLINGLHNPFFLNMLQCAEELAIGAGYQVITDAAYAGYPNYRDGGKFMSWPVDGFLMWCMDPGRLEVLMGEHSPPRKVVYLGYARSDEADYVAFDRYVGSRQAMEHLLERGHQRIAWIAPPDLTNSPVPDARLATYRAVCREQGLIPDEITIRADPNDGNTSEGGMRAAGLEVGAAIASRSRQARPTAVLCFNDLSAISVLHGVRRAGLRVPEDIAIVGFDGITEGRYLDKRLTTVAGPMSLMVEIALRILKQRMDGDTEMPRQAVLLPTRLEIGETS